MQEFSWRRNALVFCSFFLVTPRLAAADEPQDAALILKSFLSEDWRSQVVWPPTRVENSVVMYRNDGSALWTSSSQQSIQLQVTTGQLVIVWLSPGATLQCLRYTLRLRSDVESPGFLGRLFGGSDKPAEYRPAAGPRALTEDAAKLYLHLDASDLRCWPAAVDSELQVAFGDAIPGAAAMASVFVVPAPGTLTPGAVRFRCATAAEITSPAACDNLYGIEKDLPIDGARAVDHFHGKFKHADRQLNSQPCQAVTVHIAIITPRSAQP